MSITTQLEKTIKGTSITSHKSAYGLNGFDFITDTSSHVNLWYAIKADGAVNAVFNTLGTKTGTNGDGITLKAGDTLYGEFDEITLTSGKVIAYRVNKQD